MKYLSMRVISITLLFVGGACLAQEQKFSFAKRDKDILFENALTTIRMTPYETVDKKKLTRSITMDSIVLHSTLVKLSVGKVQQISDANNTLIATIYRYGTEGTLNKITLPDGKEYLWSSSGPSITYLSGDQKIVCTYVRDSNSFKLDESRSIEQIPAVVKLVALEDASRFAGSTKVPIGIPIALGVIGALIRVLASE